MIEEFMYHYGERFWRAWEVNLERASRRLLYLRLLVLTLLAAALPIAIANIGAISNYFLASPFDASRTVTLLSLTFFAALLIVTAVALQLATSAVRATLRHFRDDPRHRFFGPRLSWEPSPWIDMKATEIVRLMLHNHLMRLREGQPTSIAALANDLGMSHQETRALLAAFLQEVPR